jgi:hypothetical protein
MAIKEHRCFTVACDVCGAENEGGYDLTAHYDSAAEALSAAEDYEWHTTPAGRAVCDREDAAHHKAIRELHAAAPEPCRCWIAENDAEDAEDAAPHLPAQDAETDRTGDGA